MFIDQKRVPTIRSRAAFTLTELMIALGLSCVVVTAIMTGFIFCSRSLAAISSYTTLAQNSQAAIDQMTREIREMGALTNFTSTNYNNTTYSQLSSITNSLTFIPVNATSSNSWVTFKFNPSTGTVTRTQGSTNTTLLTGCNFLNFEMFQRNQSNGTFTPIPTASPTQTKLVQICWVCSRNTSLGPAETESVESAKVVIRSK